MTIPVLVSDANANEIINAVINVTQSSGGVLALALVDDAVAGEDDWLVD